jgi:hypothetical protein
MLKKTLLLLMMVSLCGCAVTPEQRLYDAKLTFLGTLKTVNVLKEADRFSDKDLTAIRAFAKAGQDILVKWEAEGSITPDVLGTFETILEELIKYRVKGVANE